MEVSRWVGIWLRNRWLLWNILSSRDVWKVDRGSFCILSPRRRDPGFCAFGRRFLKVLLIWAVCWFFVGRNVSV